MEKRNTQWQVKSMRCKDVENYRGLLYEGHISNEIIEAIYSHAEDCEPCKRKLEFEEKIKSKLIVHFDSVIPSLELRTRIKQFTSKEKIKIHIKPALTAACLIFLLGFGIFFEKAFLGLPKVHELHSINSFHILSDNIDDLEKHTMLGVNKAHLASFDQAGYIPHGALKVSTPLKGDVKLIALKNNTGNKVSICFLPRSYNLPYSTRTQVKDTHVHHGKSDTDQFIFWQGNKNTIVLVGDNMSHEELISLAYNLIGEV